MAPSPPTPGARPSSRSGEPRDGHGPPLVEDDLASEADPVFTAALDAAVATTLLACAPGLLGGAMLHGAPSPVRDGWLALLRDRLAPDAPMRKIPLHVGADRLTGGLDLAATLATGRPVQSRGLLAALERGVALLPSAERQRSETLAILTAAMDAATEDDPSAAFAVLAFDESAPDDGEARPPAGLADRLAFVLPLEGLRLADLDAAAALIASPEDCAAARARLAEVEISDAFIEALTATALTLGVASLRAPLLTARAARVAAAIDGRSSVSEGDATLAARLVLAPRATRLPTADAPQEDDSQDDPPPDQRQGSEQEPDQAPDQPEDRDQDESPLAEPPDEVVLAAAAAAIPSGLLEKLKAGGPRKLGSAGAAGALRKSLARGRPIGARPGDPRAGARLDLLETLRAAAPWRVIRARAAAAAGREDLAARRILVAKDDLRVKRFKQPAETAAIFVVDASGSAAFQRLAEAKGAVELLLGESYVRRDHVALIAFRGTEAEILLPPTRALARVKRALAGLPGGGGTPLAAGVEAAAQLAEQAQRRGWTPTVVFLTDGRANIARDGAPGRAQAEADAKAAAKLLQGAGVSTLLIDTGARPHPAARSVAEAMGARYLPMPYASSQQLSAAVKAARAQG